MTTDLILGSNGQDGSYLAEVLLGQGHDVIGVARQAQSRWVSHRRFRHVKLDLAAADGLTPLLQETTPSRIYALAAVHGSSGYDYEPNWRDALNVNVGSIHTCLEHIRSRDPDTRLFMASSLKAFGDVSAAVIDESTPRISSCLYGITKNAASELIDYYRSRHGVWASISYFFNHDSPRRPVDYFLPRLVAQLAAHLHGEPETAPVWTLDFWCDWGSSLEFMSAVASLLELDAPNDVVMASGVAIYGADLALTLSEIAGVEPGDWVRAKEPVSTHQVRMEPPFRVRLDGLNSLVGTPKSDGLDVALWILRERHGIDLQRPPASD